MVMVGMIDYVWIVEIVSEKVCDLQKKIKNDRELAFRGRFICWQPCKPMMQHLLIMVGNAMDQEIHPRTTM